MEDLLSAGIIRGNLTDTLKEVQAELANQKKAPSAHPAAKVPADLSDIGMPSASNPILEQELLDISPGEPSNHQPISANTVFDCVYKLRDLVDRAAGIPLKPRPEREKSKKIFRAQF